MCLQNGGTQPPLVIFWRYANAIFLASRGFPAVIQGTAAAAPPAGRGNGVQGLKPWISNYEMEGVDRVNIIIKREDVTQAEATNFPIGDPANLGLAGAYVIGLPMTLNPGYDGLPTESDFETLIVNHVGQLGLMEQFMRCMEMMFTCATGKGGAAFGTGGFQLDEQRQSAELGVRTGMKVSGQASSRDLSGSAIAAGGGAVW